MDAAGKKSDKDDSGAPSATKAGNDEVFRPPGQAGQLPQKIDSSKVGRSSDFQFINLDPTNLGRDKKTQTVVRKHVMRGYRRSLHTHGTSAKENSKRPEATTSNHPRKAARPRNRPSPSSSTSSISSSPPRPLSTLTAPLQSAQASAFHLFKSFFCRKCAKLLPDSKPLPSQTEHLAHEICSCLVPEPFTTDLAQGVASADSSALILGSWRTDPFNSLCIDTKHKVPVLINHYRDVIQGSRLSPGHLQKWQSFMYTDPAVLHCTLYYAANHAQILAGLANNVDVFYHRGEAIRLLNERMDDPEKRASDGTIAAVASLALFEDMFGSAQAAASHRTGLYQLVSLRGGLKRLGQNGVIERLVLWAGDASSDKIKTTEKQPTIKPTDPETMPGLLKQISTEHKAKITQPADLRPLIMELFSRLRNCFMLVSRIPHGPRRQTISFPPKFRIMSLLNERDLDDPNPVTDFSNSNSWLIACLLYVHAVLYRGYEARVYDEEVEETIADLVDKLQAALKKEQPLLAQKKYPPRVLLWTLFVGGVNASEQAQLLMFQPILVRVSKALELSNWQAIRQYLADLPQFQPEMESGCKALWNRAIGGSPMMSNSSTSSSPRMS